MINFVSRSNIDILFGRPLTISELIERRKNSPGGVLELWGMFRSFDGVFISKGFDEPICLEFYSDRTISIYTRKEEQKQSNYPMYILFTSKRKAKSFIEETKGIEIKKGARMDSSYYYTEVYD